MVIMIRTCHYCKEKAPPDANFCSMCGARLPYVPIPSDEPKTTEKVQTPTVEKYTTTELPPILTAKELSKHFRISVSTISQLVKENKIPYMRVGERRLLFPT
jgi:excisionase family DNA binding protein